LGGKSTRRDRVKNLHASPEKPLTGRFVLLTLVGFFAVVFAVNFAMMKLAIDTLPGTEVDSAYSASLGYAKEIVAAHDQNMRNWRIDAHIQRGPRGDATLQVEARDDGGTPLSGMKFLGRLERPTDRRADQPLELAEVGIGIYRGKAPFIAAGQWDLVIEGDTAGQRMFLSKNRVFLN
jgi:nitrogen fixation protein FixH